MKKTRGLIFIPILAIMFVFGFIVQPASANTDTTEKTTQTSEDTASKTEGAAQTSDETAATEDTTQTKDQSKIKSTEEAVAFKDQSLATIIRDQLGIKKGDTITKSDLANLTFLFAENISDLSGLEYATNLSLLEAPDGKISNLSPLKGLKNLQTLNLAGNKITDISVLTQMSNLTMANLANNPLNFNSGSAASKTLQTLVGKGVNVYHDDMVKLTTKKVTKDSITVAWNIDQSDGMPHLGALTLNGKQVKSFDVFKKAQSEYTFTGLKEGQTYDIELSMSFNLTQSDHQITKTLQVKAEDVQPEQQVTVTPVIDDKTATIGNLNGEAVKEKGTLAIDLRNYKEDQVNVQLTADQIKMLQDKKAAVQINKGDSTVSIPTQLLGNGQDVTVEVDKQKPVKGALSSVYDFTIKTATGTISKFTQPVTLTFSVDPSKVKDPDNVKVWYYNPSTKEWEYIGGTYKNGVVTAQTYHFSTYTVFEKAQKASSSTTGTSTNNHSGSGTQANTVSGDNSQSGTGHELPNTATHSMNFITIGALLVLSASAFLLFQRRKQKA
ncbi:LPXTG-motif cell wall-anchored protein [Pullulanibacillus pueri]|uniref:Gram-positive cocci surface proteins LPxTG domain-containing protein n=1 Tax=Pullulanibacillus pueri TaxID=1437324 RepID=A0A8J3ELD1_9BACL|nr:LPXTG cell wall anchor domain-containing protein [Pullulanibacillus pueri]MBM7681210.1 LPXTG-motif cell wall-anchored protein [Pullulanibacillus pueri]GGH78027.1 hypothetical protein GCM10007096_10800 [Pullulanibacillus pueri]